MEKIVEDLLESKLKQKSLGKAYQSVQALASSLIMSSVQWEDLEGHLESTRSSIEDRFQELELREKDIGAWAAQLERREFEFDSKADELRGLKTLLGEKMKEVTNCKNQLHSLQSLITEHSDEVLVQEKRLQTVEEFVREKERECESIESKVKERNRKLNWVERSVEEKSKLVESKLGQLNEIQKDLELKEELAKAVQRSIEKCDKELLLKEESLGSVQKSLAECSITLESKERRIKEIELKEKDLGVAKKSLEEWSCELDLKERELGMKEDKVGELRKSVEEGDKNLDTMSKGLQAKERKLADQTEELALKRKEFDSIRKSTEERSQTLKSKERQLEDQAKELELKQASIKSSAVVETKVLKQREKKLEDQTESLKAKEGQLEDKAKELELKEKEFESVKKSIEEQIRILKENERQLEVQAKELKLKQNELDSMKQSLEEQARNLKSKENSSILHAQVKIEQPEHIPSNHAVIPSSASNQCSTDWDGRGLQLFMSKHLKSIDSAGSEITAHLQASNDPAKLVLDAMQGFYPSDVNVDNMNCDFDLGIIRRSCIVLLETLKRVSPKINPQVKEEATKLAGEWKAKMKTERENWLEVLGFLRLVTIYDIASDYDAKELQNLIATVGENDQATELSQAVGGTETESPTIVGSPVKTENPESSPAKEAVASTSQNLQLTATTDARNMQEFADVLSRGNEFMQKATGDIRNLIETNQLFEAVRLICTVKLVDTIPPVPLLKKFVENLKERYRPIRWKTRGKSLDERDKVVDEEIAILRDVIQCIKDCNLDSEYPISNIRTRIADLERNKEGWRRHAASNVDQQEQEKSVTSMVKQPQQIKSPPSTVVQQQEQELNMVENGKKRRWNQQSVPEPHRSNFQRTSESAARPYALPAHTPSPGHYFAAPNGYGAGSNCGNAQQFTYLGMHAPYNYAAGAIPGPGMQYPYAQCMPSAPRYGPYRP